MAMVPLVHASGNVMIDIAEAEERLLYGQLVATAVEVEAVDALEALEVQALVSLSFRFKLELHRSMRSLFLIGRRPT